MRYPDSIQIAGLIFGLVLTTACASRTAEPPQAASSPAAIPAQEPQPAGDGAGVGTSSKPTAEHDEATPSHDDSGLVALLPSSKIGLADGIALAERRGGKAISAKFEVEDGKLSLSVYVAKAGLDADAEHNVLAELSGDPTQPEWRAKEAVFSDIKHITRASYHLTLVQRAKMNLAAVIAKAQAMQPGQVYAVEPAVHERSPIFHVSIAKVGGGHVVVDVESGA
jgi:hypothetical protein